MSNTLRISTVDDTLGPTITRLTIQAILAFNNELMIVPLTAGQLLAALANSVSAFPIHDGRFPQLVAGLRLAVNATMPPLEGMTSMEFGSRVETVTLEGQYGEEGVLLVDRSELVVLVATNWSIVLATNSFLASGGNSYVFIAEGVLVAETGIGEQQVLESYIRDIVGGDVVFDHPPPRPPRLPVVIFE